ncbi:hypothetical protein POTOM_030056 [Populus tomentosa]|uniref:CCHC-type domain-containing protein n=1 Tax=Populus tomentosa TaxID=118781 RepID=A0A8X7ZE99_POPTO|nr:hypothetical protein POTOM_030056 [Populus tomentosa]
MFLHDYPELYCATTEHGDLILQQRSQIVHWIIESLCSNEINSIPFLSSPFFFFFIFFFSMAEPNNFTTATPTLTTSLPDSPTPLISLTSANSTQRFNSNRGYQSTWSSNRKAPQRFNSQSSWSTPRQFHSPNQASPWQSHHNTYQRRGYKGICQFCDQQGHSAKQCPRTKGLLGPSPAVHCTTTNTTTRQPWLLDSAATNHVTADLQNLSLQSPYNGPDSILIGDGTGLSITHSGSTQINPFTISNVLCVPSIQKNLVSVSQFCKQHLTSIEFFSSHFSVKDLRTGQILLQGPNKNDVYEWPQTLHVQPSAMVGVKTSHQPSQLPTIIPCTVPRSLDISSSSGTEDTAPAVSHNPPSPPAPFTAPSSHPHRAHPMCQARDFYIGNNMYRKCKVVHCHGMVGAGGPYLPIFLAHHPQLHVETPFPSSHALYLMVVHVGTNENDLHECIKEMQERHSRITDRWNMYEEILYCKVFLRLLRKS